MDTTPLQQQKTGTFEPPSLILLNLKMCLTERKEANGVVKANELSLRELKIVKLNARVDTITREAVATSVKNEQTLALEFVHSQQQVTALTAGAPVYQLRSSPLVYVYGIVGLGLIVLGVTHLHPLVSLLCIVTTFLGYDFYSGILHVVLDHPSNIAIPVIGQACLEFQWHHSIPDDLVRNDFVDVCGDLNVVIGIITGINLFLAFLQRDLLMSSIAHLLCGMKIFMAYYGQFSHRSAHSAGSRLSPIAKFLQKWGFMVSTKDHLRHHQSPFDEAYCLIGFCNPLIDAMRKTTHSNAAWLSLFIVWSIFDTYAYIHLVEMATSLVA